MIHVDLKDEPEKFEARVRKCGRRFLARCPNPTSRQWRDHAYWTEVGKELHSVYGGICAYSCHWIAYDTGWRTVEHYLPKDINPDLAYEWNNYRLVCGVLNGRKGTRQVLDPFLVQNGWFIIDFPSLLVLPSRELGNELYEQVVRTCEILGLNDEDTCMKSRAKYVEDYCKYKITFDHLACEAPFIAQELERQGLVETIREIMIY
jgi:hypothetical protein